jgi:hypothetical protein
VGGCEKRKIVVKYRGVVWSTSRRSLAAYIFLVTCHKKEAEMGDAEMKKVQKTWYIYIYIYIYREALRGARHCEYAVVESRQLKNLNRK